MPRALWSGAISFGLVNIPVKLYAAREDKSVGLHLLSEDGTCRLRRKLYCPETGEEYDFKHTARGYEIAPGQYVLINQEELDRLKPESGYTIEIKEFVELEEIDPIMLDKAYYLLPDEKAVKPYALLAKAMAESGKVALARLTMRNKEYLCAVRIYETAICLQTMHYADEIRPLEDYSIPDLEAVELKKEEVKLATQLIESLTNPFELDQYSDRFRESMLDLIERKAEGESVILPEAPTKSKAGQVIDLMSMLKKSIESEGREGGRGSKTRAAAKKAPAKKAAKKTKASAKTGATKAGAKKRKRA